MSEKMTASGEDNPFASLFSSPHIAEETAESARKQREYINHALTRVFLVTGQGKYFKSYRKTSI